MRSRIRIVKPKRVDEANHEANESKKSAEPRAGKIVSTIKGWIAESQERKRNQRRSLPLITAVVLIAFVAALAQSPTQPTARPVTAAKSTIKVSIATVASSLGPPTDHYKPPGKYELTMQRRLACCDGPMVESNKTSFEVVP